MIEMKLAQHKYEPNLESFIQSQAEMVFNNKTSDLNSMIREQIRKVIEMNAGVV